MFAIDILLRSYYNLGQWQAVLDVAAQFPEVNTDSTVNRARSKLIPHHRQEAANPNPNRCGNGTLTIC